MRCGITALSYDLALNDFYFLINMFTGKTFSIDYIADVVISFASFIWSFIKMPIKYIHSLLLKKRTIKVTNNAFVCPYKLIKNAFVYVPNIRLNVVDHIRNIVNNPGTINENFTRKLFVRNLEYLGNRNIGNYNLGEDYKKYNELSKELCQHANFHIDRGDSLLESTNAYAIFTSRFNKSDEKVYGAPYVLRGKMKEEYGCSCYDEYIAKTYQFIDESDSELMKECAINGFVLYTIAIILKIKLSKCKNTSRKIITKSFNKYFDILLEKGHIIESKKFTLHTDFYNPKNIYYVACLKVENDLSIIVKSFKKYITPELLTLATRILDSEDINEKYLKESDYTILKCEKFDWGMDIIAEEANKYEKTLNEDM